MSFAICFIFSFLSLLFINGTTIGADDYLHSIMFGRDGFDNSLFVNYFYATFITALQKIMPGFNAFVILEILLSFLAFWGICNTLFKKFSNKTALVLSITVNGIFSCLHYFTPLWSYTAVLLCLAGSFELIYSLNNQKKKPLGIVYGIIFIILGAMIRKNQFYVCAAFLVAYYGAIIIYKCFTNRKNLKNYIKSINIKKYGSTVMLIALAIILPFGIQFVSDTINYSSDGYNDYRQYNTLRSSLNDYDYPPYVGNETFLTALAYLKMI